MGRKSLVWEFFTPGVDKARCNRCRKWISVSKGSTGALARHLKLHNVDVSKLTEATAALAKGQRDIRAAFTNAPRAISSEKKARLNRRLLAFFVRNHIAFNAVDSDEWKEFCEEAEIGNPISKKTMTEKLLPTEAETVKAYLKEAVKDRMIAITADCWSSKDGNTALLSTTAHFIDEEFRRKNEVIAATSCADFNHTGMNLAEKTKGTVDEFGIDGVCSRCREQHRAGVQSRRRRSRVVFFLSCPFTAQHCP